MIKMSDEDADQLLVRELLELPQDSLLNQDFSFRDEMQYQNSKSQISDLSPVVNRFAK